MWAGIKKALNSTLGTSEFKPLDQLIAEGRDLVASDNLFRYLYAGEYNTGSVEEKTIFKFKTNRDGSFRLKFNSKSAYNGYDRNLEVYRDGERVYQFQPPQNYEDVETTVDIQCYKGAEFEIKVGTNGSTASFSVKDMRICASELDITGITVL